MDTAMFKAQAVRLAQHLAAKHGVTLKHAAALEAVAALHGARDWNTLAASSPALPTSGPGVPAMAADTLEAPSDPHITLVIGTTRHGKSLLAGPRTPGAVLAPVTADTLEATMATLRDDVHLHTRLTDPGHVEQLYRSCFLGEIAGPAGAAGLGDPSDWNEAGGARGAHTLVFGAPGLGAAVLLEQLALRHVADGGGLLYVSDRPDAALAEVLRQAAAEAPHQPQFLSLAPPNEKGVQTCAPRLDALVQSGYLLHLAPTAGQASSAAHAGTCMLLAQLGTVLAARQGAERRRPLLVVLPAARFDMSWLALLLRQGRALGVSFVLQADTPAALGRMGAVFANTVLANVGAQLFLTPADGRALEYAAAHMAATSGVALAQARQALSAVGPGAALRLAGERLELIRYDGKPAGRSPQ